MAEAVSGSVEKTALQSGFSREDAECLCRIGTELGRTDREGQMAHLTLAAQQIAARRDGAKERAHTLSRLYLTLGGAGGLVAALLVW